MLEHLPAWITAQWPCAIRELFGFSCLFNTMALQGNRREVCEIVRSCYFTNSQSAKSCFLVPLLEILLCSNSAKTQPHFPKGGESETDCELRSPHLLNFCPTNTAVSKRPAANQFSNFWSYTVSKWRGSGLDSCLVGKVEYWQAQLASTIMVKFSKSLL